MSPRAAALLVVALLALPATAAARDTVYVTNQGSASVSAMHIAADGTLSALGAPVPSGGATPVAIALTPDGRRAFVADEGPDTVQAFTVAGDGSLAANGAPVATGGNDPSAVAVAPDGRFAYVANRAGNSVRAFAVQGDGTLSPIGAAVPTGGIQARSVVVVPGGGRVYVASSTSAEVTPYAVGVDGGVMAIGAPVAVGGADTFDVVVHPDGGRLFGANFGTNDVPELAIGGDGVPAPTGVRPSSGETHAALRRALARRAPPVRGQQRRVDDPGALDRGRPGHHRRSGGLGLGQPGRHGRRRGVADALRGGPGRRRDALPDRRSDGTIAALSAATPTGGVSPRGIALRPDQGPVARVSATGGALARFDASGSSDDGAVARYDWDFGDGTSGPDAGPTPAHAYASRGTYTATVTVTDDAGCSTRVVTAGRTVACNGGPAARAQVGVTVPPAAADAAPPDAGATPTDTTGPALSKRKLERRLRAGAVATLRFTLSEPAAVTLRGAARACARRCPPGRPGCASACPSAAASASSRSRRSTSPGTSPRDGSPCADRPPALGSPHAPHPPGPPRAATALLATAPSALAGYGDTAAAPSTSCRPASRGRCRRIATTNQIPLYDGLTPLFDQVGTGAGLPALLHAGEVRTAGGVTRRERPRSGLLIERDRYGVPTVTADDRDDVMFGAGWVTAQDRGTFIEAIRDPARSRRSTSQASTPSPWPRACASSNLVANRAFPRRPGRPARRLEQRPRGPPRHRRLSRRINAYYRETDNPAPKWTIRDVTAIVALIGSQFGQGGGREVEASDLLARLQGRLGGDAGLQRVARPARGRRPRGADHAEHPVQLRQRHAGTRAGLTGGRSRLVRRHRAAAGVTGTLQQPQHGASNALLVGANRSRTRRPLGGHGPAAWLLLSGTRLGGRPPRRRDRRPGSALYPVSRDLRVHRPGKDFTWSATTSASASTTPTSFSRSSAAARTPVYLLQRSAPRNIGTFNAGTLKGAATSPTSS